MRLLQEPELLVLDEPEAGVDFHGGFIFCELLDSLRKEQHFTQLMVSHDLSTITHHATHVINIHFSPFHYYILDFSESLKNNTTCYLSSASLFP